MPDQWYPAAEIDPGPSEKVWPDQNACAGVVLHSMEGYWPAARAMLQVGGQVSWHFSILQDGRVIQSYPLDASPWHAGSKARNVTLIGIEHEGVAGMPLTAPQLAASKALVQWLGQQCGWVPSRNAPQTLWEHCEISYTSCPNQRIPWEEYSMVNAEKPRPLDVASAEDKDLRAMISALANNRITPIRFDPDGRAVYEMSLVLP